MNYMTQAQYKRITGGFDLEVEEPAEPEAELVASV